MVIEEIDSMVKEAQIGYGAAYGKNLRNMKPVSYFYGLGKSDPELPKLFSNMRRSPSSAASTSRRTSTHAPNLRLGWTGSQIRHGGSAPVDTVPWSQIKPRYATNIAMRDAQGNPYLTGGGKVQVGANGKPTGFNTQGQKIVDYNDLPSTRMMQAANGGFYHEGRKLLKQMIASRNGGASVDPKQIAKMKQQWADVKAGKVGANQQTAILNQWRSYASGLAKAKPAAVKPNSPAKA